MFKNILLGVDGSPHSMHAAKMSGELARSLNADLRIVVVFEPIPTYLGESLLRQTISSRMENAEHILLDALAAVGEIPGQLQTETLEGPVAEAILIAAETHNHDLIVMGSRGLGNLSGLLLGSQSQKVVQHASCPVLITR
jgi:nucleotide-binding universal stress UspA family protein